MAKYHISPTTGRPNKCYAEKRPCPHGGVEDHYPSKEEAQQAYEGKMSASTMPAAAKKAAHPRGSVEALHAEYEDLMQNYQGDDRYDKIQRARKKLEGRMPPPPAPAELMVKLETPAGFTRTEGTWDAGWHNEPKELPQLTFEGDGIKIEVNFDDDPNGYMLASGHVSFTTDKGARTFDRHGVEDSFYIDNPRKQYSLADPTEGVNEKIRDFIERKVPESRARIAGQETVPGLQGRLISADKKKQVQEGKTIQLMPAGFGTGYALSTKRTPYAREATAEQKRFFGVNQLWISSFDCD